MLMNLLIEWKVLFVPSHIRVRRMDIPLGQVTVKIDFVPS